MTDEYFLNLKNPILEIQKWIKQAQTQPINYPHAMSLASFDERTKTLSSRTVLIKDITPSTLTFYTNYLSKKASDIDTFPFVSGLFYWDLLRRQIKLKAKVQKLDYKDSCLYWDQRDKKSQISQYLSQQSHPIKDRGELEKLYSETEKKFQNKKISCPQNWGGYVLTPFEIEFWVEQSHRLHDRFCFKKSNTKWSFKRLYP